MNTYLQYIHGKTFQPAFLLQKTESYMYDQIWYWLISFILYIYHSHHKLKTKPRPAGNIKTMQLYD